MPPDCQSRTLRTRRLVLRPALPADFAALHAIFADPRAMRYWDTPVHEPETTRRFLAGMIAAAPGTSHEFVVEQAGRVIGKAGCWRPGELGYIFHPDTWGQGIATEALRALVPDVFRAFPDLAEIHAEIDSRNTRSERLLLGLGFVRTGHELRTLKVNGVWTDSTYFTLARAPGLALSQG